MRTPVAIVGGGPAASAAALSLARRGIASVIVERGDDQGDKPGESLPPSARPLLEALGVIGAPPSRWLARRRLAAAGEDACEPAGEDAGVPLVDALDAHLPASARPLPHALGIVGAPPSRRLARRRLAAAGEDACEPLVDALDGHLPAHGNRSVWGSDAVDEMPFIFSPYGHGWHLDRRRFERLLIERALAAGAARRTSTRVAGVARDGRTWRLRLRDGATIESAFLIDATGRAAWLSRRLGATRVHHDRLIASVAFLEGGRCDSTTLIEAAEGGWWYSAALPDDRLAVMFVSDAPRPSPGAKLVPSEVEGRHSLSPGGRGSSMSFSRDAGEGAVLRLRSGQASRRMRVIPIAPHTHTRIPPHTRARIDDGGYTMTAPERRVDAGSARLDRVGGAGWLAIGDAAMSLDPLSSHGLMTALATGLAAGETIAACIAGSARALDEYQAFVDTSWRAYARMRHACYAAEGRWADAPFWRRRREVM